MSRILLVLTVIAALGTAALGVLNQTKMKGVVQERDTIKASLTEKDNELQVAKKEADAKKQEAAEAVAKKEQADADLAKARQDVEQAKSQASELQKQIADKDAKIKELDEKIASTTTTTPAENPQLAEAEKRAKDIETQLAAAQEENKVLATKITDLEKAADGLRQAEARRVGGLMAKGLEGQILAYNPAWNFVVLNIGDRQGVANNAEMVVKRNGAMVGKIRITSVEPSSSIADVVSRSVAGQIQPGDTVIYAQ